MSKFQPPLSRDRILQTALQLADAEGLEALSMRKLAQVLGVKAMSLYNHVANKKDIIEGIVDRVMGEIELPDIDADWKTAMRGRAISAYQVLLRHPWAAIAIMSGVNVGPAALRYVDATLGCLRKAGFSWQMADYAWNTMDSHIYGFTLQALNFPFEEDEYAVVAKEFISIIPPEQYPYLNGLTQEVIAQRYNGIHQFEFGLDILLDGLERLRQ
ncbi:MAG: TetR/AcrR family transcriptional regulator [Cyanobacteria bacterium P01_F01_bin.150]